MKKTAAIALAVLLLGSLCACGRKSAPDIDLAEMGAALAESGAFSGEMSQPSEDIALRIYGFEEADAEAFVFYTGTGATADEMLLAKAAAGAASSLTEACARRAENQKLAFKNYAPAEAAKLDSAILETAGDYVFFIVAADTDAASAVVDSYIG